MPSEGSGGSGNPPLEGCSGGPPSGGRGGPGGSSDPSPNSPPGGGTQHWCNKCGRDSQAIGYETKSQPPKSKGAVYKGGPPGSLVVKVVRTIKRKVTLSLHSSKVISILPSEAEVAEKKAKKRTRDAFFVVGRAIFRWNAGISRRPYGSITKPRPPAKEALETRRPRPATEAIIGGS